MCPVTVLSPDLRAAEMRTSGKGRGRGGMSACVPGINTSETGYSRFRAVEESR